ncbi:MAG TPA: hypothetical protein VK034_10920 [Enhygromyxa sp.]|nr:hypothetical protein [Enhygromyxa sp.]
MLDRPHDVLDPDGTKSVERIIVVSSSASHRFIEALRNFFGDRDEQGLLVLEVTKGCTR